MSNGEGSSSWRSPSGVPWGPSPAKQQLVQRVQELEADMQHLWDIVSRHVKAKDCIKEKLECSQNEYKDLLENLESIAQELC